MQLYHRPFDPLCRFIRLTLAEYGVEAELVEEKPWERREDFVRMNPACALPLLVSDDWVVPGAAIITEFWDEQMGDTLGERRLLPKEPNHRLEVRRLIEWFNVKFHDEVSEPLVSERIEKRFRPPEAGGGAPDGGLIRAARHNVRHHLHYIGWLVSHGDWVAGKQMTLADLAAAAHLSSIDYLGDVPWGESEAAKLWYARMKSRPSFRSLLSDKVVGMPPSATYADLDF